MSLGFFGPEAIPSGWFSVDAKAEGWFSVELLFGDPPPPASGGDLLGKAGSIITLTTSGASMTSLSGATGGTDIDTRASGNADGILFGRFELLCRWTTVTGIVANYPVLEIFLVPKLDGTNAADIDLTSGAASFPHQMYFGVMRASKAPTSSTDMRFVTVEQTIPQGLYTPHLRNVSGQTVTANWTLKFLGSAWRYT